MADIPVQLSPNKNPPLNKNVSPFAPILIVDQESADLHRLLRHDFHDLHFEMYSCFEQAESNLPVERYQALIINVRIAGMHDFSLLKMKRSKQPGQPFLVAARIHDKALAHRAIQHGALGCILKPITDGSAASTLRRAISLSKLWTTMAHTENMLEGFKDQGTLGSIASANTARSRQRSIAALERSLQLLKGMAYDLEQQARYQALERLKVLEL
jgi:DNA-binding NtrC family response regulator